MKKVLLVKPEKNDWFPLGYAYLVASWKQAGIDFDFIDLDKDPYHLLANSLVESDYMAVCAGGLIASYSGIKKIMSIAQAVVPSMPRIVGGPLTTNVPLKYIFADIGAHYATIGEGEETTVELIQHIAKYRICPSPSVRGTAWVQHDAPDGFSVAPSRPKPNIETLPDPDYSFWDYKWHRDHGKGSIPWNLMPVLTGRGCIGSCAFCSPPAGKYRCRSPKSVVSEIERCAHKFDAKHLYFADEMFFNDSEKIAEFCSLYKEMGTPYTWSCNMRVDGPIDSLALMREHGCTNIYFGFESVNDRVLAEMKKRTTHEMQKKAIAVAKSAGIFWQALWMVGNYSETLEEMRQSFAFFREHHQTCPALLITYPGTLNYSRAQNAQLVEDELAYIESLGDLFIGPVFQRLTKFIHKDLPYLNISAMETDQLFKAYCEEVSLLTQAMEITSPRFVTQLDGSPHVEGLCPHCGNLVILSVPEGQPFNIHGTRCPHCNPMWLNVSPLKLDVFQEQISAKKLSALHSKQHVVILDHSEHMAFFFVMKNHLGLDASKIGGFIQTASYTSKNIFYYPVVAVDALPPETDCVLIVASTEATQETERFLQRNLPTHIELIDLTKP